MVDSNGNIIDNIPEYVKGEWETPTAHHFYYFAEDITKLSQTAS